MRLPELELTYGTEAGRKNMEILENMFKHNSPKSRYHKNVHIDVGAYRGTEFMSELNTLSINHRKHDFVNNAISNSLMTKRYKCVRTEFESQRESDIRA